MSLPNPAVNPPFLAAASSQARSQHSSRSPSRSPRRNDPLLRDLSPTKTLQAFSDGPRDPRNDVLARSLQHASPSEHTLGTQVAQACTDLRAWTRELDSWHWPGTFDLPEPARKKQRMSDMTILSRMESDDLSEDEHWGSLTASAVNIYEKRLEEVCVQFDSIDFEVLKEFVLAAHGQAGVGEASIDDSIGTIGAATDLKKLDDFTAVITATILQALPYLPKLTRLLETWTTRLSILRSAPRYLRDLKKARTDLDHGWAALAISHKASPNASLTSESLDEMKALISGQVYSLGKRLDRFLDMLEGRQEVVPDSWIDDFEDLEQEYGEWVVRAEKKVLEDEWKIMKKQVRQTALGLTSADEPNTPNGSRGLPNEPAFDDGPAELEANEVVGGMAAMVGPAITTRTVTDDNGDYSTSQTMSRGIAEHAHPAIITTTVTSASEPPSSRNSPPRRRHVPIVIDYNNLGLPTDSSDEGLKADSAIPSPRDSTSQNRGLSRTGSNGQGFISDVKRRAAFLNGDIEKDQSLLKGKSAPIVRPFEHASNAFTRLFKRDSTDSEESRKQLGRVSSETTKRSMENEHQHATSLLSGSGSSNRGSTSTSNKNSDRMQYMDMVNVSPDLRSNSRTEESSVKRGRTKQRETGNRMAYGDLVMAVPARDIDSPPKMESSKPSRPPAQERIDTARSMSKESKRSKSAGTAAKRFAMELMGVSPGRKSIESQQSKRPMTPSDDYARMESLPAVPRIGETRRHSSVPPTQRQQGHDLTALPPVTFGQHSPRTYKPKPAVRIPQGAKPMNMPQTYRPTGFDPSVPLPAEESQFPENWPLSATPSEAGDRDQEFFVDDSEWAPNWAKQQASRQQGLVNSEQFEEFFVRTLPDRSAEQRYGTTPSSPTTRDFVYDTTVSRPKSAPGFRPGERRTVIVPPRSSSRGAVPKRPFYTNATLPRPISMVLEEDFASAQPESLDNAAAYFGSQGAASAKPSELEAHPVIDEEAEIDEDEVVTPRAEPVLRRASAASMESFSRDEVKAIDIPASVKETPPRPITPEANVSQNGGPMNFNGEIEFPSPPSSLPGKRTSVRSSISSGTSVPALHASEWAQSEAVPLNAAMQRKRGSIPRSGDSTLERDVVSPVPSSSPRDNFDRHVSKVLDKVQAPIKFKSRPGVETPVTRKSLQQPKRADRKSLTLVPAESSPRKASSADPEVKLYHLTQTGRSEPIKLYVRLVGEGSERVMVRVGGGWMDLADYLRQYAEHHGSRTVSEGNLELQTADAAASLWSGSGSASGKRTASGSAFAQDTKSRSPATTSTIRAFGPTTVPTTRVADSFDAPPRTSSSVTSWGSTIPSSRPRLWIGSDSDEDDLDESNDQTQTPQSPRSTKSSSRPTTAYQVRPGSRPDSRSAADSGAVPVSPSLGGAFRSEQPLPEQKAKWVEGMIEKAMKSASAAGGTGAGAGTGTGAGGVAVERRETGREFGDLGRVGGTRRMVFKGVGSPGAEAR